MVGGWTFYLIQVLLVFIWPACQGQDCWESCFSPELRDDQYKDEYREIMELISNLRSVSATSGGTGTGATNGTAFLLDTSAPDSASADKVKKIKFH